MKQFQILLCLIVFVTCFSWRSHAASQDWDVWLEGVRAEALHKGISQEVIDASLSGIHPIERVIELDRKQPEGSMSFATYKGRVISDARISNGRAMMKKHAALLDKVSQKYGVPPQYIVALWGIETSYGNYTGGFSIIPALATLAYDGRRSTFFRKELMNALTILEQGHITPVAMKGSWAGAMGQNQFMPSSFHSFAVDGNDDGKRDIWGSLPDVFSSTANYLSRSRWKEDERWGRAVKLPQKFPETLIGLDTRKSLAQWKALGVTLPNGGAIPVVEGMQASLVAPDGVHGDIYLAYDNYRVIMKWNRSTYFATSVGLIADAISR